jgi:predicted transcriptional regulator
MSSDVPRIAQRGFRPHGLGIGRVLGELETAVMEALWESVAAQSVSDVERHLRRTRDIAHTTVLTTLDRLHRKGYLTREKRGKAFIYAPRYTRAEFEHGLAQEVLGALLNASDTPALSAFVDMLGDDPSTLDRLEALIREKRRDAGLRKRTP